MSSAGITLLVNSYYTASQNKGESVTPRGIGIEEILQKAIQRGLVVATEQRNNMQKERFWRGLYCTELQNSISVLSCRIPSVCIIPQAFVLKYLEEKHQVATRSRATKGDKGSNTKCSKITIPL